MTDLTKAQPSRRERERQRHEQEILDAAEAVFCRDGYSQASIQSIAEQAEFSVGTLYNFFKGKEEIYHRMMERKAQEVVAFYRDAADAETTPTAKVRRLIAAKAQYFSENRDFFRVYVTEMRGNTCHASVGLCKAAHDTYMGHLDFVAGIFRDGIASGEFKKHDPMHLTSYLESLGNAFLTMYLEDETGQNMEKNLDSMIRMFFEGASADDPKGKRR